jgi:hypothetical protein
MSKEKKQSKNWPIEQEDYLIKLYEKDDITNVHEITELVNDKFDCVKNYRSIISKLVNLGIYKKEGDYKSKTNTVKTMLKDLEEMLEITFTEGNLNKKENLTILVEAVHSKLIG